MPVALCFVLTLHYIHFIIYKKMQCCIVYISNAMFFHQIYFWRGSNWEPEPGGVQFQVPWLQSLV